MDLDKKDLDIIDAYLNGELSDQELADVKSRMASDSSFLQSVQFMQATQSSLRMATLQDKLKMLQNEENQSNTPPSTQSGNHVNLKTWLIFFVLLILAVSVYMLLKPKDEAQEVFAVNDDMLQNTLIHKTVRSTDSDNTLSTEQRIAYDLYAIQEFEDAIPRLHKLWEQKRDTLAYFYLGVSYLAIGDKQKSLEILSDTIIRNNPIFKDKIETLLNQ